MIKIEKYIPISFSALAIFVCYMMTFVSMPWFGFYNKLRYLLIAFVYVYIIYNYRYLKCNWVSSIEKISLVLYIVFSFVASYLDLGKVTSINPLVQCINQCGIILANFLLTIILSNRGKIRSLLSTYFWLSLIVWVIFDLSIIFHLYRSGDYIFGNKFTAAYHHIRLFVIILLYIKEWNLKNKTLFICLIIETMLINVISDCATGIVGTFIFIMLLFLYYCRKANIIQSPFLQMTVLLSCALFPIWYEALLSSSWVQYLVEVVLHKQITLTGRTVIYSKIPEIFGDHILWGYGIASNMDMCMRFGAINIQNGIMKVMMESGIFGVTMLLILYFAVFWRIKKTEGLPEKYLSAYLLIMSVLSAIEITINVSTIVVLLYLSVFSNIKKELVK